MDTVIPFVMIVWMCAMIFIVIGVFALNKKTPMHFWSGTKVKSEEISDIKSYNKSNGIMWISYGAIFVLADIISVIFNTNIGGILVAISSIVGVPILIIVYKRIYNKYKNK
ncbi:hypothetical protein Curi_c23000 [Gottschalkia acidurici 9a]|uniref:DUF3784 domain-containing protein n=1 Tax=Gottschalkia acidurici (strain ATCC 7906 / DSM 604 / BCRC 14475 / CIP 104303 / KCTC 5404 / NCIMB 10678 / 9a) TaxID=1128398 RepID=K0B2G8_GOTA9|nr:hypothetical protein [Gottschalkia acidurici]AFS79302.1 hypothetical protein Curi_c23000 [Gottschalkia acidurici 9a]